MAVADMCESIVRGKDIWEVHCGHDHTELGHVGEREGKGEWNQGQKSGSQRYKRGRATKMSGLYRETPLGEEEPRPWPEGSGYP